MMTLSDVHPERGWWRSVCLLLVLTVALSPCPIPLASAAAVTLPVAHHAERAALHVNTVSIPEELGRIVYRWQPQKSVQRTANSAQKKDPKRLVVHIQDLHTHAQTQETIAALLAHLREAYGIRTVAVEGADGPIDLTDFSRIPDTAITSQAANVLLQHALLTGAEYDAITHPGQSTLCGVEEGTTYLQHLQTYRTGQTVRQVLQRWLAHVQPQLADATRRHYPRALRRLRAQRAAYEAGDRAFRAYAQDVFRRLRAHDIPLDTYPALARLERWYAFEVATDLAQVGQEHQQLLAVLVSQLRPEERATLFQLQDDVSAARITPHRYYATLKQLAEHAGMPLVPSVPPSRTPWLISLFTRAESHAPAPSTDYPHLARYMALLTWSGEADARALSDALEHAYEAVAEELAGNGMVRQLWSLDTRLQLLNRLLHAQLSPAEWASYDAHRDAYQPHVIAEPLQQLTGTTGRMPIIAPASLVPLEQFYALALQRDRILTDNTIRLLETPTEGIVLIAGGFHTPGVTRYLREKDIAHVVIAPRVAGEMDDARYRARLNGQMPSIGSLLREVSSFTKIGEVGTGHSTHSLQAPTYGGARTMDRQLSGRVLQSQGQFIRFAFIAVAAALALGAGYDAASAGELFQHVNDVTLLGDGLLHVGDQSVQIDTSDAGVADAADAQAAGAVSHAASFLKRWWWLLAAGSLMAGWLHLRRSRSNTPTTLAAPDVGRVVETARLTLPEPKQSVDDVRDLGSYEREPQAVIDRVAQLRARSPEQLTTTIFDIDLLGMQGSFYSPALMDPLVAAVLDLLVAWAHERGGEIDRLWGDEIRVITPGPPDPGAVHALQEQIRALFGTHQEGGFAAAELRFTGAPPTPAQLAALQATESVIEIAEYAGALRLVYQVDEGTTPRRFLAALQSRWAGQCDVDLTQIRMLPVVLDRDHPYLGMPGRWHFSMTASELAWSTESLEDMNMERALRREMFHGLEAIEDRKGRGDLQPMFTQATRARLDRDHQRYQANVQSDDTRPVTAITDRAYAQYLRAGGAAIEIVPSYVGWWHRLLIWLGTKDIMLFRRFKGLRSVYYPEDVERLEQLIERSAAEASHLFGSGAHIQVRRVVDRAVIQFNGRALPSPERLQRFREQFQRAMNEQWMPARWDIWGHVRRVVKFPLRVQCRLLIADGQAGDPVRTIQRRLRVAREIVGKFRRYYEHTLLRQIEDAELNAMERARAVRGMMGLLTSRVTPERHAATQQRGWRGFVSRAWWRVSAFPVPSGLEPMLGMLLTGLSVVIIGGGHPIRTLIAVGVLMIPLASFWGFAWRISKVGTGSGRNTFHMWNMWNWITLLHTLASIPLVTISTDTQQAWEPLSALSPHDQALLDRYVWAHHRFKTWPLQLRSLARLLLALTQHVLYAYGLRRHRHESVEQAAPVTHENIDPPAPPPEASDESAPTGVGTPENKA